MVDKQENLLDVEARIRASFGRQGLMQAMRAQLIHVALGAVDIELLYGDHLTQQHDYLHGAAIAAIGDTACGYSALTLMPMESEVVTVEYKINFVAPAQGEKFVARGRVTKAGRTLTVCGGEVFAVTASNEKLVATMLATMMRVPV